MRGVRRARVFVQERVTGCHRRSASGGPNAFLKLEVMAARGEKTRFRAAATCRDARRPIPARGFRDFGQSTRTRGTGAVMRSTLFCCSTACDTHSTDGAKVVGIFKTALSSYSIYFFLFFFRLYIIIFGPGTRVSDGGGTTDDRLQKKNCETRTRVTKRKNLKETRSVVYAIGIRHSAVSGNVSGRETKSALSQIYSRSRSWLHRDKSHDRADHRA